jgi:hypothetical protein
MATFLAMPQYLKPYLRTDTTTPTHKHIASIDHHKSLHAAS